MIDVPGAAEAVEKVAPGKYEVLTFPTMNEVMAALRSGRIDAAQTYEDYANFIMKSDDGLTFTRGDAPPASLSMLTREADVELTTALNSAIETLKENGKLDELYEQYVANASPDDVPEAPEIATIDGAKTITVGVSGDFPPHDYVSVDGRPAGYNVALMGEIAQLAGFNVAFETAGFNTKFSGLVSQRIDLFFLHAGHTAFEGIIQTAAYDEEVYLGRLTLK
ncbi:transporter substrate-binding domain-containing protein [Eubacteriales bacterium OttesenSCG-928-N13]|nr:transporter substrate-binding domain-containing protein [Eubacteriales bacterium OttesenSCG-928-N13]